MAKNDDIFETLAVSEQLPFNTPNNDIFEMTIAQLKSGNMLLGKNTQNNEKDQKGSEAIEEEHLKDPNFFENLAVFTLYNKPTEFAKHVGRLCMDHIELARRQVQQTTGEKPSATNGTLTNAFYGIQRHLKEHPFVNAPLLQTELIVNPVFSEKDRGLITYREMSVEEKGTVFVDILNPTWNSLIFNAEVVKNLVNIDWYVCNYVSEDKETNIEIFYYRDGFTSSQDTNEAMHKLISRQLDTQKLIDLKGKETKICLVPQEAFISNGAKGFCAYTMVFTPLEDETSMHEIAHALVFENFGGNLLEIIHEAHTTYVEENMRTAKGERRQWDIASFKYLADEIKKRSIENISFDIDDMSKKFPEDKKRYAVYYYSNLFFNSLMEMYGADGLKIFKRIASLSSLRQDALVNPLTGKQIIQNGTLVATQNELAEAALICSGVDPYDIKKHMKQKVSRK